MGVNELSMSTNEDNHSEEGSTISTRDQNVQRKVSEQTETNTKDAHNDSQGKDEPSIKIVEAGGKYEHIPTNENHNAESQEEVAVQPRQVSEDAQQSDDETLAESHNVYSSENSNCTDTHTNKKNSEEDNYDDEDNEGVTVSVSISDKDEESGEYQPKEDIEQKMDNSGYSSKINQESETEFCAPELLNNEENASQDNEEMDHQSDDDSDSSEENEQEGKDPIAQLQLEDQNRDSNDSLFEALNICQEEIKENNYVEPLEISTNILSYERFFPGRILGNTFVVKNVSTKSARFQLSFDNQDITRLSVGEKLCDYYGCDNINEIEDSYTKHLNQEIDTSEEVLKAWYVEDPYTKKLTKNVKMELGSGEEYEFIIVLKSPVENKQNMLTTNVLIRDMDRNTVQPVFCYGCMESLKVSCPKEMYNTKLKHKMIKVMMRRKQAAQPIKVLLENKGDMPVMGNFQSVEMEKNLQFYIPRDKVTIEANSKALLEIKAMHKLGSQASKKNGDSKKPEVIHKLVIAKIKDCEFKFSLIFEITIV